MLKVMRDSFHHLRWVLIAVVASFVFGFVFVNMGMGGSGFGGGAKEDRSFAAKVNGETITYTDYYRALKNMEDMYRQMYGQQFTPEMASQMGLQQQVLNSLVDQKLLVQEAKRIHLQGTPEEVRKKLLSIPTFSPDGKFVGMELYNRYVTGPLGYSSAAEFEGDLADQITLEKMESALQNSVIVSPKAADAEYRRTNENAKIRFVLVPAAQAAANVKVSDAEVEAHYKANQSQFAHGAQRTIRYLLADYTKIRALMKPTDEDLRRRYEAGKSGFSQPASAHVLHILIKSEPGATPAADAAAKGKAESIVKQLRAGADFATLARANSEDPSSSGNGGDMGFVTMGQTVEPFERAIFSVPLNTISEPIRTKEYGYHIVKVTERRAESVRPFEEVRLQLALQAATDMAKDAARDEINRVNAVIKQNKPADLNAFVALANDKVTSNDSGWFARNEPIAGIGQHEPLADWVFKAKNGDISDPIGTPRGIAIAYLAETRAAGVSSLAEVRQKVEEETRLAKARDAAKAALAQTMAGLHTIDEVAAKTGQTVREATVNRQGPVTGLTGDSSQLVDAALTANVGELKGPIVVGDGAVVMQVTEQKRVTPAELAQARTGFTDSLRTQQARSLRSALVKRLRKDADVTINDEIMRPTTTPTGI
jgi:peptidyl-prolyl cis-trans isomerase D